MNGMNFGTNVLRIVNNIAHLKREVTNVKESAKSLLYDIKQTAKQGLEEVSKVNVLEDKVETLKTKIQELERNS